MYYVHIVYDDASVIGIQKEKQFTCRIVRHYIIHHIETYDNLHIYMTKLLLSFYFLIIKHNLTTIIMFDPTPVLA